MKQPELGRKITELRKAKGWTQEELVERCNVSVRTIQRIETGEVTPRSFTIKTILSALDYDLEKISVFANEKPSVSGSNRLRNFLLIDIDIEKPSSFLIRQLNVAWIFGILYFLVAFLEGAAEYFRFTKQVMVFSIPVYIAIKVVVIISYVCFQRGFVLMGGLFRNYLLKITSIFLIGTHILLCCYDIASVFYDSIEREFIIYGAALCYGAIGVVYGVALRRLEKPLGRMAELAGFAEIIAALFFITIFLAFIGQLILIPAELFEIILIFNAIEVIKSNEGVNDSSQ
jgi:transcriptional regulator with XRE-family HTH domain